MQTHSPVPIDMEISMTHRWEPFSKEEKQQRQANHLFLYYGGPKHIETNCAYKPKCLANQITNDNKNESKIVETSNGSNIMNNPNISNKFEVLSQSKDESNE